MSPLYIRRQFSVPKHSICQTHLENCNLNNVEINIHINDLFNSFEIRLRPPSRKNFQFLFTN